VTSPNPDALREIAESLLRPGLSDRMIDDAVRGLCERYGYGAVMYSASRQWAAKPAEQGGLGAFTVGPPMATVEAALGRKP